MTTIKSYTSLEQSQRLAEILPLESADMVYVHTVDLEGDEHYDIDFRNNQPLFEDDISAWSLAALLGVLPEINGVSLKTEKVKAEDGYDGYYYNIEYEGIVLIPYSKNPIDACVEMIIKLHEQNLL